MSTMNSLIQSLNDKYLDLDLLLKDFDEVLSNTEEIETVYEDETGRCFGALKTFDEYGIEKLYEIYNRLVKIVEGE